MFSGPFNGTTWEITQASGGPASGEDEDVDPSTGILVPTALQMSRDALAYWSSITCLFDRYWVPDPDKPTLPFCFFHITKYVEQQLVETSKKRMIMYEDAANKDENSKETDRLSPGVMQVAVDNMVVNPMTYSLEAIVPYQPVGRYIKEGANLMAQIQEMYGLVATLPDSGWKYANQLFADALKMSDYARKAWDQQADLQGFRTLADLKSASTWQKEASVDMDTISPYAMINKHSLDAMVGKIVCLKNWTGNDYKYVAITEKTAEKRVLEDKVWRVSLKLQDMPILRIAPVEAADTSAVNTDWQLDATKAMMKLSGMRSYRVEALSNEDITTYEDEESESESQEAA